MNRIFILFLLANLMYVGGLYAQGLNIEQSGNPNKWIFHNPNSSVENDQNLALAHWSQSLGSWDWGKGFVFRSDGGLLMNGPISAQQGRFSSFYSANCDGLYPAPLNQLGASQLTIGANWTSGYTDLSLINSNIANTGGGGFSFWQLTSATSKKPLAYFRGNGQVGIGTINPMSYANMHVDGAGGILSTGSGAQVRIRDQQSTRTSEQWLDEWAWYATGNVARFHRPGLGDVLAFSPAGNVGIGTISPGTYKLAVEGKIGAREIEVKVGNWADFVFAPGYRLRPLNEVKIFIDQYGHLPEIPSEAEVKQQGINLGEMNAKLLQKIEELTLYMLHQQQQIDQLLEDRKTSSRKAPRMR